MANRHTTLTSLFSDIADAIRDKTGENSVIKADDFDTAINAIPTGGEPISDDYFYIESRSGEDVQLSILPYNSTSQEDILSHIKLKYSSDKIVWNDLPWNVSVNTHTPKVYIKNDSDMLSVSSYAYIRINPLVSCNLGGRIGSLLNDMTNTRIHPYSFYYLFQGNMYIWSVENLKLTSTTGQYCCAYMFNNCVHLTDVPIFQAKSLEPYCYISMFANCNNLTSTAGFNSDFKYASSRSLEYMFENCISLTTPPSLSNNKFLDTYCYRYMFAGCTSLIRVPVLPARSFENGCYVSMFDGCSSLEVYSTPPEGTYYEWQIPGDGPTIKISSAASGTNMFRGIIKDDGVPETFKPVKDTQTTFYVKYPPVE